TSPNAEAGTSPTGGGVPPPAGQAGTIHPEEGGQLDDARLREPAGGPLAGAGSRPVRGHSRPQPVLRRAGGADGGRDRHDQRGAGRQPAAGGDVLAAGGTAERGDRPRPGDRAEGLAARPDVATTGRPGVNGPATGAGALPAPFVPRSQADLARPGLTTKLRDNLAALRVRDQLRREIGRASCRESGE